MPKPSPDPESFEPQFKRLVDAYVSPPQKGKARAVLDILQPVTVILAVITIVIGLPQSQEWFKRQQSNTNLMPLTPSRYANPQASSYLDTAGGKSSKITYSPSNLLDDNPSTAWQECEGGQPISKENPSTPASSCISATDASLEGAGAWVEIRLIEPTSIRGIKVRNGYQRSLDEYKRNPRVRKLHAQLSTPRNKDIWSVDLKLTDDPSRGYQYLDFDSGHAVDNVSSVRLTIESAYPSQSVGDKAAYADTSLSDVELVSATLDGT